MGARTDLKAAADTLAAEARRLSELVGSEDQEMTSLNGAEFQTRAAAVGDLAAAAKTALEGAALVVVDAGPLAGGLARLVAVLEEHELAVADDEPAPADVLEVAASTIDHLATEARARLALETAILGLTNTLHALHRDFAASTTPTAKRISARIQSALEDAEQTINAPRRVTSTKEA